MTIDELLNPEYQLLTFGYFLSEGERLRKFAEYHVNLALQAAAKKAKLENEITGYQRTSVKEEGYKYKVSEESILSAYPLDKIV